MTPHVPNTSGSSIRSGPSHTGQRSKRNSGGHSSGNNHNSNIDTSNSSSIAAMNLSGIDKKRPRALEESPQSSRKKIAGELMAFQFQSLSLSNADGSPLVEGAVSSGFLPQLHLPVQQQTRHEEQRQQQLEPSQQQFQHQRSRAVSSPVVSEVVSETTLRKGAPLLAVAVSTDSSSSNYSPLPPHITPPPVTSAATLDLSMLIDEGRGDNTVALSQNLGQGVARNSSASSSSSSTASSTVKVLSLRQRKWNSVSKEWQEWQEGLKLDIPWVMMELIPGSALAARRRHPNGRLGVAVRVTDLVDSDHSTSKESDPDKSMVTTFRTKSRGAHMELEHDRSARPTLAHIPSNTNNSYIIYRIHRCIPNPRPHFIRCRCHRERIIYWHRLTRTNSIINQINRHINLCDTLDIHLVITATTSICTMKAGGRGTTMEKRDFHGKCYSRKLTRLGHATASQVQAQITNIINRPGCHSP
ncbi:hypothetical protein BGZ99_009687 [Dissophora globulifera]|uniref:Uncharacterized protein n=1 Tax=Dissophora globulifera TaxID=979702 RepID=A0A9P6RRC6_9FUNG|nr:hypothetical protein BGZ99_009687 [Dissophora globulifera]